MLADVYSELIQLLVSSLFQQYIAVDSPPQHLQCETHQHLFPDMRFYIMRASPEYTNQFDFIFLFSFLFHKD